MSGTTVSDLIRQIEMLSQGEDLPVEFMIAETGQPFQLVGAVSEHEKEDAPAEKIIFLFAEPSPRVLH